MVWRVTVGVEAREVADAGVMGDMGGVVDVGGDAGGVGTNTAVPLGAGPVRNATPFTGEIVAGSVEKSTNARNFLD